MTLIDVRTVFVVYFLSSALCTFVMASLWLQNRKRYPAITLWFVDFALQFTALLLITLRGTVPDIVSIVFANTFIIGGTVILYIGLERYIGKESRQWHNYVMLIVFTLVHAYLTFVYPSLTLRNVNLSFGLLYISVQVSWLMLRRVEPEMRPATRATGVIFAIFSLVSVVRIVVDLMGPRANELFKLGIFDTMVILTWLILFISLTFALVLLVSRRLSRALEHELVERQQAEKKERILLNSTAEAIYGIDMSGNCTFANQSCVKMLGYSSPKELLGKNMHNLIHHSYPDGKPMPGEICRIYKAFRIGEGVHVDDEVLWKKDGSSFPVEYWSYPQKDNDKVFGAVVTFTDITERKLSQELIRLRLSLFEFATTHSLNELLQKTLDEVGVLVNSPIGFYHFLEKDQKTLSLQAWSTRTVKEFCKAEGKGMHYGVDQAGVWVDCVRERRTVVHNDYNSLPHRKGLPEGHATVVRELVVPIMKGENIVAILGVGNKPVEYTQKDIEIVSYLADVAWEIAERKKTEEELHESEESIRAITNSAHDAITMIDNNGNISYWNPAAERILGYKRKEVIGVNLHKLIVPERFLPAHLAVFPEFQKTGQGSAIGKTLELAARRKDGQEIDIALSLSAVNIKGTWHSVGIMQDITERKKTEEKLQHMATHDSLTDLPTLRLAEDRLAMAMSLAHRHKEMAAVMFIDLDGFKTVNDTLGHDAGDYLLKQVAQRLLSCVRKTDTVARVGGDEFLLIATELKSSDDAENIAKKAIKFVSKPVTINGRKAKVSASIGIAFYPDHGENIDQLIKLADEAMYRIKKAGKNGFGFAKMAKK